MEWDLRFAGVVAWEPDGGLTCLFDLQMGRRLVRLPVAVADRAVAALTAGLGRGVRREEWEVMARLWLLRAITAGLNVVGTGAATASAAPLVIGPDEIRGLYQQATGRAV